MFSLPHMCMHVHVNGTERMTEADSVVSRSAVSEVTSSPETSQSVR